MHLINVETWKLEAFLDDKIPRYAILSHTWGVEEEEISFDDIRGGNTGKPGNGTKKLKGCCDQAKKYNLKYAWIDTCCINKNSTKELDEAINSMFQWYRKASFCFVYLSDVPHEDNSSDQGSKFFSSRWFQRGWTLQELLAPEKVFFYSQEWTLIGEKGGMCNEIEMITGIPRQFFLGWEDFRKASVAQRMSWAAKRKTTRKEDIAYCLLGIFDLVMPMIYGERDRAFSRLQIEIMKNTGDISILAWGLNADEFIPDKSTAVVSAGVLATAPSDFANCGHIVPWKQDISTFHISSGCLQIPLTLHTTPAGKIYGLLNCGPENDAEQAVGIPLHKVVSGAATDGYEYLRPQAYYSVVLPRTISNVSTKVVRVLMERQSRARETMGQRFWLHIDGLRKIKLTLEEVYPPVRLEKERALIAEANDLDGNIIRRYLARFRDQGEQSRDVILVLEFELQRLHAQLQCHVMTLSRDTSLDELSQKLIYMRAQAFGKRSANNGNLNVKVTVNKIKLAQQTTFVATLAQISSSPETTTIDATLELRQVDLKLESVKILQEEDQIRLETERLNQERDETLAILASKTKSLALVDDQLRKLSKEKELLTQDMSQLRNENNDIEQRQLKLSERQLHIQQRLDELGTAIAPKNWLAGSISMLLDTGKIGFDLKGIGNSDFHPLCFSRAMKSGHNTNGPISLLWASANGHQAILKKLLEEPVDLEYRGSDGRTSLSLAAGNGHKTTVRLLLEKGADQQSKDKDGRTPLVWATKNKHEIVVKMLTSKGKDSRTPPAKTANRDAVNATLKRNMKPDFLAELEHDQEPESSDPIPQHPYQQRLLSITISSIWDDAGAIPPVLDAIKLQAYRTGNLDIINAEEPKSGLTPLAKALLSGNATTVKLLLDNGASPDKKTRDGRTPMYLAADALRERRRMIQLLLDKDPATFDDEGPDFVRKTPLMAAVRRDDPEAVKLLVERGASKEKKNSAGKTARELVDESKPMSHDVKNALELSPTSGNVKRALKRALKILPSIGAPLEPVSSKDFSEPMTAEEFKQNLENMVARAGLEKFFPPGDLYVKEVADRAAELRHDCNNLLNSPAQIDALAKLALYQPVLYCDDSGSMWNEDNGPGTNKGDRWQSLIELVKKMTDITTRAVPNNRGCHLRFINRDTPQHNDLDERAIEAIFNNYGRGNGWTPIGTKLREHVLDQLVYPDLESGKLIKRPFLVMCITDGFPTQERAMKGAPVEGEDRNRNQDADRFRKELWKCGQLLESKDYKMEVVRFCLSRIGNITDWEDKAEADKFWEGLKSDPDIQDVLYMTEDILDEKFQRKQDQKELEIWLLTTLLSPLQSTLY